MQRLIREFWHKLRGLMHQMRSPDRHHGMLHPRQLQSMLGFPWLHAQRGHVDVGPIERQVMTTVVVMLRTIQDHGKTQTTEQGEEYDCFPSAVCTVVNVLEHGLGKSEAWGRHGSC